MDKIKSRGVKTPAFYMPIFIVLYIYSLDSKNIHLTYFVGIIVKDKRKIVYFVE